MKIRQIAKQKTFTVDTERYSLIELMELVQSDKIVLTNRISSYIVLDYNVKSLNIVLDTKGKYATVAILKDGSFVFIKL